MTGRFSRDSGITISRQYGGRRPYTLPGSYGTNWIADEQRRTGRKVVGTTSGSGRGFPILPVEPNGP